MRYVIDKADDPHTGRSVYRVWEVSPAPDDNTLVGTYDSLAAAKASVVASWRSPDREDHEAWGFGEEEAVPGPEDEEDRPPPGGPEPL